MRSVGRYLFRLVVLIPFGLIWVWFMSLIPTFDFDWYGVPIVCVIGAFFTSKSIYSWKVILNKYEKPVPGLSRLVTKSGFFRDKYDSEDDGFPIFSSITSDGLVLYRPHVISSLREVAVVPWTDVEVTGVEDRTPKSKDGLVDQDSDMLATIRIKDVRFPLEIPWSKEIELFTNVIRSAHSKEPANKSMQPTPSATAD